MSKTSILYENHDATVFLIDIPTSIALAQSLSPQTTPSNALPSSNNKPSSQLQPNPTLKRLLSSPALERPYTSTEPKSVAARARALQRIPRSEREVAAAIEPVVLGALGEIRSGYREGWKWCFSRCLVTDRDEPPAEEHGAGVRLGKKRRKGEEDRADHDQEYQSSLYDADRQAPDSEQPFETVNQPPLILSPGLNKFESGAELHNHIVKNTSSETATVKICPSSNLSNTSSDPAEKRREEQEQGQTYIIPPLSKFLICNLPISTPSKLNPIPGLLPNHKFNLILLDPPWSNRSVRRSGHYQTQTYLDSERLTESICNVLRVHSYSPLFAETTAEGGGGSMSDMCVAAIWITNSAKARKTAYDSLIGAGFTVSEEWVWVKTTVYGEPVTYVEGLWRKPYEVLVVGVKQNEKEDKNERAMPWSGLVDEIETTQTNIRRRVIVAVPDVHSRKPNLREAFERVFFSSAKGGSGTQYEALEVFARNLTAGWWACGNEVLKFNDGEWWVDSDA
ncbi:MT-A70-domain-containing protein [Aspergillus granulosus]|uniref:MT-A70-domain-containing protein n=1 Tax=Aspergillus granulosus TaxID=176169 RepID=A0ABR4HPH9_9EURO